MLLLKEISFVSSTHFSLRSVRAKVWRARRTSPLFNCKIYARDLERLYYRGWRQYETGVKDHMLDWPVDFNPHLPTSATDKDGNADPQFAIGYMNGNRMDGHNGTCRLSD